MINMYELASFMKKHNSAPASMSVWEYFCFTHDMTVGEMEKVFAKYENALKFAEWAHDNNQIHLGSRGSSLLHGAITGTYGNDC